MAKEADGITIAPSPIVIESSGAAALESGQSEQHIITMEKTLVLSSTIAMAEEHTGEGYSISTGGGSMLGDEDEEEEEVEDGRRSRRQHLWAYRARLRRFASSTANSLRGLCDVENYRHCLWSCLFFFSCQTISSVLLNICCLGCLTFLLQPPETLKPRNGVQKVLDFCVKQLANLWASAWLSYLVYSLIFQPFTVTPVLGASAVHVFELIPPAGTAGGIATPHLSFNLTTHLLLRNEKRYRIGYNHLAASVMYAGEKLGPVDDEILTFEHQKPYRWTVLDQVVVGRLPNTSSRVAETFARERAQGRYEMVVRISVTLSYKSWPFKAEYFYMYDCPLSSPVLQAGDEHALSTPAYCNTVNV